MRPSRCGQKLTYGPVTGSYANLICITPNFVIAVSLRGSTAVGQQDEVVCQVIDISRSGPLDHSFDLYCSNTKDSSNTKEICQYSNLGL